MPQAARRGISEPRPGGGEGCPFPHRRASAQILRKPARLQRGFCGDCGSPILNRAGPNWKASADFPDPPSPQYGIPLAILDDPPARPALHCFVASKAPWFEITDNLPQYQEYPPPG